MKRFARLANAFFVVLIWSSVAALSSAQAAPFTTYGFAGASGGFAVSCSGPADASLPSNPADNRVHFQPGSDCTGNPLTPSANSNFSSPPASLPAIVSASGTTTTSLGAISGFATMSTNAQSTVQFPAAFTDAGWIDTLLIENTANDGMAAIATVILNVSGTLSAPDPNVFARLQLVIDSEEAPSPLQQSYQIQATSPDLIVNDVLMFDLPFTIGTPSQFLVRAMAQAMTASANSGADNLTSVDFMSAWGGIEQITVGGNVVTSPWTAVGSVSGINWAGPFPFSVSVPEPTTLTIFGLGLAWLGFMRRRRKLN